MQYKKLANIYDKLSTTSSRLEKTFILAIFLREIQGSDIEKVSLLLQGRLFPEWDSRKIGIAAKIAVKAIVTSTGHSEKEVMASFKTHGDLGLVARELNSKKRQQTLFSQDLTLDTVFKTLTNLANHEGTGSQDTKVAYIHKLLGSAKPIEAQFIIRTILEDLRIGIAGGTIRDAILYAFFTDELEYDKDKNSLHYTMKSGLTLETQKELVRRALDFTSDVGFVISHILSGKPLDNIKLNPSYPCKVMLARKEKSFDQAFERTGRPCMIEYKYDGFRVQIHKKGNEVYLFTRRLENVTKQFPDVVKTIQKHVKVDSCIIDSEVVGYDTITKKYKPFQSISQRIRRKYDIDKLVEELPVEINVFDVLTVDGKLTIDMPLTERLPILNSIIDQEIRKIVIITGTILEKNEDVQKFFQESLDAGNEGIMFKDLQGRYIPGGRVSAWIKFKPVMDELDLVITAAEWGEGKRSDWMTSFTLACRDDDGNFLEIGKVGTGFKEIDDGESVSFGKLTEVLRPLIIKEVGRTVRVKPSIILMIQYEEIQKSPTYSSGFALRFPRVLRMRPDRAADDCANIDFVLDLYESQ